MTTDHPAHAPIRGCTCSLLRRLTRRVTAVYDRALAETGLRVTQYSLLSHLRARRDEGGVPIAQLADALDMDRTTLTRNLKPLVAAGWVDVGCSAADGRQRLVCITADGIAQLEFARPYWRRAQNEVTAALGPDVTAQLHGQITEWLPRFRPATQDDD